MDRDDGNSLRMHYPASFDDSQKFSGSDHPHSCLGELTGNKYCCPQRIPEQSPVTPNRKETIWRYSIKALRRSREKSEKMSGHFPNKIAVAIGLIDAANERGENERWRCTGSSRMIAWSRAESPDIPWQGNSLRAFAEQLPLPPLSVRICFTANR